MGIHNGAMFFTKGVVKLLDLYLANFFIAIEKRW
jgi:hypothetical protein